MSLTVKLSGEFSIRPGPDNVTTGDGGQQFGVHNDSLHTSATIENSQSQAFIGTTGSFTALPVSADNKGLLFFFSPNSGMAVGKLRITYSTTGIVTIPVRGGVIVETDTTDFISAVEFQGSATFDWALTGVRT